MLTAAAIALAAEDVTTQEQAEALFSDWSALNQPAFKIDIRQPDGTVRASTLMPAGTFDASRWDIAQLQVRELLPQIAALDPRDRRARAALCHSINQGLVLDGHVTLLATPEGVGLRLQHTPILGAISFGLLPFVVPEGWHASRLGQCRRPDCGRYFLRRSGHGGRIQVFCKPPRTCATVTHVREFRAK